MDRRGAVPILHTSSKQFEPVYISFSSDFHLQTPDSTFHLFYRQFPFHLKQQSRLWKKSCRQFNIDPLIVSHFSLQSEIELIDLHEPAK
jgi:hypothetical protein